MITIPVSYKPSAFALMLMEVAAAPDTQSSRTSGTPAQYTPPSLTNGLSRPIIEALATIGASVTTGGTQVTATSESAGPSGSGTQTSVSIISATTVRADLNLRDLCNMEAVLTGNTKGLVRPCVGASKVVDALMQLATGPDVALAVAAREFLPEIASAKDGPDGQSVITLRNDPAWGPLARTNLPEAAAAMSGQAWSDGAIFSIASSMANGRKPAPFAVNFLHAKMFDSFTLINIESTSTRGDVNNYNADLNRNFGWGLSYGRPFNWEAGFNRAGKQPLASFSARALYARYNAF
jgi:hypothetical protein